ncbi:MAG: thiamine phosphate synthase [Rikenellaceae bacterium]|nr:thiamine phosphate synthase [Rikenellaceae bacterium]
MEKELIAKRLPLQWITPAAAGPEILDGVRGFLQGGGRWVQLRLKNTPEKEILEIGRLVLPLCRSYGAVLIVNDHPELALRIGADGVHLGKEDISPIQARQLLGPEKIVGCTANTFADIQRLNGYPIDYIGLGPFRFTETKKNLSPVLGLNGYRQIFSSIQRHGIRLSVTVIGGITLEDVEDLKEAGAVYFAVSGAIGRAEDPVRTTAEFLRRIHAPTSR